MPKPTIEARLLTPPALDFTAENLTQTLQAGNPADRHLVVYEDDDDTRIAPIPGRPDLLMRWVDVGYLIWAPPGDPRVGKVDPRNEHLKPADRHIEVFEAELARLSSARDKYGFGVRVPTHATFLVPNDPYDKHGADVFYTVVERLTDTESIPGGGIMDGDYRLKRWHREYKASLAIMGILTTYYLGETTT